MAEVIWTIKAVEQVEQIGSFIEKDSPFQARRVIQLIVKETRKLEEHPRIGKMIPEVQEDRYRDSGSSATGFCIESWRRTGSPLSGSFTDIDCSIPNGWNDASRDGRNKPRASVPATEAGGCSGVWPNCVPCDGTSLARLGKRSPGSSPPRPGLRTVGAGPPLLAHSRRSLPKSIRLAGSCICAEIVKRSRWFGVPPSGGPRPRQRGTPNNRYEPRYRQTTHDLFRRSNPERF